MRTTCCLTLLVTTLGLSAALPPATADDLRERARQVLAQLAGEISLPGLTEPVEVLRDRWGVPHIYAKNQDDLFFAQGFVAAQDRLFQLDLWRRVNAGETAELFGPDRLEGDRFARLIKFRGDLDKEWASYSPDAQRIATQFVRGINACIDHLGDRLPIEFHILGYKPKKWQPEDCLGRMSGIILVRNWDTEISRSQLINAVGLEKARWLRPTDPRRAFAPVRGLDLSGIDKRIEAGCEAATKPLRFYPPGVKPPDDNMGWLRPHDWTASNNWAVDGTKSASGKPLLANDPHRALGLPSLRYLVHLHAPGWNVIGAGEPALPGVALGHNERIAWGFTTIGTDQSDLYVEETNPADPTEYKVGDRWVKMEIIKEQVRVKGEPKPVEVELRFTRHGPVVFQDLERRRAYALRWVGSEPGGAAYLASLAVDRARNWREFLDAMQRWKLPGLNIVYADVDGNIGWFAGGLTPVRRGWDGLLPVPGAGGKSEWRGYLAVEDQPQSFNPPARFVATANHNIIPPGYKHEISYEFTASYRIDLLRKYLSADKKFTLDDFERMQHDVTSLPGRLLVRLIRTLDISDPDLKPYAELLAGWDGVLSADARAGPLYAIWLNELFETLYRKHMPKELLKSVRNAGGIEVLMNALVRPDENWFGPEPAKARDALLRTTFAAAVAKTKERLGADPAQWTWGALHTATFRHPLATLGPAYERAFNRGPVPRPGDAMTLNNTRHDEKYQQVHGATYRQVFDLADWDRGRATSAPGQSGQLGSPHYDDLLPLWARGEYFPLAYSRAKVEEVTRHRLLLKPAPAQ